MAGSEIGDHAPGHQPAVVIKAGGMDERFGFDVHLLNDLEALALGRRCPSGTSRRSPSAVRPVARWGHPARHRAGYGPERGVPGGIGARRYD